MELRAGSYVQSPIQADHVGQKLVVQTNTPKVGFSVKSPTGRRSSQSNPPEIPFSGSFAEIRVKPLYNLLDAIRLGNQPHSSSVDRSCLVFPLHQTCRS